MKKKSMSFWRYERRVAVEEVDTSTKEISWYDLIFNEKNEEVYRSEIFTVESNLEQVEFVKEVLSATFEEMKIWAESHPDVFLASDLMQ